MLLAAIPETDMKDSLIEIRQGTAVPRYVPPSIWSIGRALEKISGGRGLG